MNSEIVSLNGFNNNVIKLVGSIKPVEELKAKINIPVDQEPPVTTELQITPTSQEQVFTPEENTYYDKVTCNSIPSQYIVPTGEIEITNNGTYDVTNYASASVQVSGGQSYRLPDEYQEVEYIESSGTQYIATQYIPSGGTGVKFKITYKENYGVVYGAYNGSWTSGVGYYHSTSTSDYEWVHYMSNTRINYGGSTNTTQNIIINKGKVYIDGQTIYETSRKSFLVYSDLYIFAGNWNGARAEQPISAKIYYFNVYEFDYKLLELIPCYRKSDGEIGMYDIVNDVFFTNAGTGVFLKGPDHDTPLNP